MKVLARAIVIVTFLGSAGGLLALQRGIFQEFNDTCAYIFKNQLFDPALKFIQPKPHKFQDT